MCEGGREGRREGGEGEREKVVLRKVDEYT